jgi:hypothetical protein
MALPAVPENLKDIEIAPRCFVGLGYKASSAQ